MMIEGPFGLPRGRGYHTHTHTHTHARTHTHTHARTHTHAHAHTHSRGSGGAPGDGLRVRAAGAGSRYAARCVRWRHALLYDAGHRCVCVSACMHPCIPTLHPCIPTYVRTFILACMCASCCPCVALLKVPVCAWAERDRGNEVLAILGSACTGRWEIHPGNYVFYDVMQVWCWGRRCGWACT
jgi:hypothetical protein